MFNTQTENQKLNAFNAFRNQHGETDFSTKELAIEFKNIYMAWWGSNLVFMGIEEINGKFTPKFNLYD